MPHFSATAVVNFLAHPFHLYLLTCSALNRYAATISIIIDEVKKLVPAEVFTLLADLLGDIDNVFGAPWSDEMRGVANGTRLPLGDIVLMNL